MKIGKKLLIPILSIGLLMAGSSEISYASAIDKMTDKDWKHITYPEYSDQSQYKKESWYVENNPEETKKKWIAYVRTQPKNAEWNKVDEDGKPYDLSNSIYVENMGKKIRILKKDQNDKNISGVTFTAYTTRDDAIKGKNPIASKTTDEGGIAEFGPYHLKKLFVKETGVSEDLDYELDDKFANENIMEFFLYDELYFLGEKDVTNSRVIKIGETEEESGVNLNEYLQNLITVGEDFEANKNVNWLVFNDNGKEKLVPKKPLKYDVSWDHIDNAKLVFGEKELTLDGKKYKIRLMRAFNDSTGVNDANSWNSKEDEYNSHVKGSEWNRLILPLIGVDGNEDTVSNWTDWNKSPYGRYGKDTIKLVEKNMPTLANYSWWKDFGGNSNRSGSNSKGSFYGSFRWTQDKRNSNRALRGSSGSSRGAADSRDDYSWLDDERWGWLPVLELAEENN